MKPRPILAAVLLSCLAWPAAADEEIRARLEREISAVSLDGLIRSTFGLSRQDTPLPCFISPDDLDPGTEKIRVLLAGGLDGRSGSIRAALAGTAWFLREESLAPRFAVSCVPCARPEAWDTEAPAQAFPPEGEAYHHPETDTAHYLWRWTGMHAPDLVVELREGEAAGWSGEPSLLAALRPSGPPLEGNSFAAALGRSAPAGTGTIPALRLTLPPGQDPGEMLATLFTALAENPPSPSPARLELQRRAARSPVEVAAELAAAYGGKMDSVMYIPATAVIGRMRLGELTGEARFLKDAEALAEPFRSGAKATMDERSGGSQISGHLLFTALGAATGDPRDLDLARFASSHGFDAEGRPKASMPFHNEMSDSVYMGCAILAETGALTGERRYFEMCLRHLRFMQALCLRDDGLYRHSPLDEAAWGRGNGFPALGLSLSLSALPADAPERPYFLRAYRDHLEALRPWQDASGAWRQVIDREESYREYSATCMIAFAIVRGIRGGWLEREEWLPVAELAWGAIKARTGSDGALVDVCTGTGKQTSPRAYFDRAAILGRDERGGAMGLLAATEMAWLLVDSR